MANEFPTYPQVLAEASPMSLSDLALMSPDEMSPEAELAYIAELRAYRERYERAMGAKPARAKSTSSKPASVILDGAFGGGADATSDVEF